MRKGGWESQPQTSLQPCSHLGHGQSQNCVHRARFLEALLNSVQRALRCVFSCLVGVSEMSPNQQRRVCEVVVIKRQCDCAHSRVFNAPQFQFELTFCFILSGLNVYLVTSCVLDQSDSSHILKKTCKCI